MSSRITYIRKLNIIYSAAIVELDEEIDEDVIVAGPRNRYIGRTLVSERVRAVIANAREQRARARERYRRPVISSDNDVSEVSAILNFVCHSLEHRISTALLSQNFRFVLES